MESPEIRENIEPKDIPQVVVVLGDGTVDDAWTVPPPQLTVTRWGDSSGSCTPNSNRSGSFASLASEASLGDDHFDALSTDKKDTNIYLDSGFENGKHFRRKRHESYNSSLEDKPQGNLIHKDIRLCSSHENIYINDGKKNKKNNLKTMFLDVFHIDSHRKRRSRSTSDQQNKERHRSPSTGPVQKIISRIRSRSYGDVHNIRDRSTSMDSIDSNTSQDNHVDESVCLNPGDLHDDVTIEFPPAAINTRLVGRYRKNEHGKKSETNSKLVFEDVGDSSTDQKGNSPTLSQHERRKQLGRTRSNSDSNIQIESEKKRKKSKLKLFKRKESLPAMLAKSSLLMVPTSMTATTKDEIDGTLESTKNRKRSTSNGSFSKSMHNLGDIAVEDHFGAAIDLHSSDEESDNHSQMYHQSPKYLAPDLTDTGRKTRFSMDNILSVLRGKSRSVDHSISSPFDLEALRRKIGDRTTSEPSDYLDSSQPGSGDGGSKENIAPPAPSSGGGGGGPAVAVAQDRKMPPQPPPPPCIPYTVQNNENLMSLAARFDTTPSELTQLNRLKSRMIFPGQVLAVPDRSGNKEMGDGNADTNKTQDALSSIRPPLSSGFSGDALRPPPSPHRLPRTPANSVDVERSLDRDCLEKFLKITVRHITDGQGVVAGVLLVTPNAVMFDPNVSDPLVIEHGPESYGVIAPMEYVVNSALYYDIAIMRVKDTNLPRPEIPKPEIYWGPVPITQESPSPAKDASLSKDTTFPELTTTASQDDNDSSCSCGGDTRESSAFPKAFEHELLTPGGDISPLNAEVETGQKSPSSATDQAHQSQPSQAVVVGDLTPIAEATQRQESTHAAALLLTPNVAQTQSDNINVQDFAQTDTQQDCNDKKRTTSVTFDLSQEDHGLTESSADDLSQETRKQKVLKRLSYPLSWMDGFNSSDKENMPGQQPGPGVVGAPPASTHPVGSTERVSEGVNMSSTGSLDSSEPKQTGVFSNVISGVSSGVSGVTNMLSRRTSLDFARRPSGSQGPPSQQQPQITTATTTNTATVTIQQLPASQQFAQPQHKRAQYKDGPKFGLKSMVSMDDMPELFASFDKLIPKPSSANDESPLYLCLRMGKPANRKIPKSTPIMSYGKKKMRPEYWFSIPKSRSDELYHFFQLWAQDIYGELNEEDITRRGFLLLEEETDVWDDDASESGESGEGRIAGEITEMTKEMTKESWEVASMSEELRRALYSSNSLTSLDLEVFLPDILGETEIITDHVRKSMYKKLPARAQGYSWKLVFSTAQHGFSLNSLYRKNSDVDSAMMIFIQDTHQNVFGAVLSCSLHVSELFYGTGECFLFRFHPEFEAFPWTGENTFFVKGNNESLIIGGGDGRFGVWLDGDLYQGRTQSCKTFDNPPMTDSEDFVIKTVECWAFE